MAVDEWRSGASGRERIKNKGFCKIKRRNQAAKFSKK
jgi:hypothetical protein